MSEDVASTASRGKLARATGRALVADNQYATVAVSCRTRVGEGPLGEEIEELGEEYLAVTSGYALALARALAADGRPPLRLEVHADCQFDWRGGKSLLSDVALEVHGDVPECDQQTFDAAAREPD